MFKVRMQGQYGAATDKRLRDVALEIWTEWGFKQGIMRGYWVRAAGPQDRCVLATFLMLNPEFLRLHAPIGYCSQRNSRLRRVCDFCGKHPRLIP